MQFTKIQNSVLSTHQHPLCNLSFLQKYVIRMLKILLKILVSNILSPNPYPPPASFKPSATAGAIGISTLIKTLGNSSQYPRSLPVLPECFHSEN